MCGILAVIGANSFSADQLQAALSVLSHRGPDGSGSWTDNGVWLGHRRLSIIDLTVAGSQPMRALDAVTVTFNGEIYNYLELRKDLESKGHRFRTRTDTEVLLHAYLEWGTDCLERLNGMWAFVIWDQRTSQAFIARDRFGVKPLYYSLENDRLVVASEPKAILCLEPQRREVDQRTLFTLLAEKRLDIAERSFYQGIRSFPVGHYAVVSPQRPTIHPRSFWICPSIDEQQMDPLKAAEVLGDILEDSVRLRLRSDVPVGLTLSGGLDSTAILEAASNILPKSEVVAFTSVYGEAGTTDERSWAQLAVRRHPDVVLNEVNAAASDWLATLDRIVWHMDGPGYSPAVFPLWEIMRSARATGVPVLLEGQGADELLAGYPSHAAVASAEGLITALRYHQLGALRSAWSSMRRAAVAHSMRRILIDASLVHLPFTKPLYDHRVGVRGALRPEFVRSAQQNSSASAGSRSRTGLDRRLFDDFTRDTLPGYLQYGDAVSMAHSIESRQPFLDHRLVSWAFTLSTNIKFTDGQTKAPLRNYLHNRGQHAIAERLDKRGYPTPASDWLAQNNGALLRDVLLDKSSLIQEYIEPRALEKLIDRHALGHVHAGDQLYSVLATELWLNRCINASVPTPVTRTNCR